MRRASGASDPSPFLLAPSGRRGFLGLLLLVSLAGCGRKQRGVEVPPGATVLALGDSLTFGTGATPESAYPAVLATLSGWQVVNAGVPGDKGQAAGETLSRIAASQG